MKNNAINLNDHLFTALAKLQDKANDIDVEVKRSAAIALVAGKIIELQKTHIMNAKLQNKETATGFFEQAHNKALEHQK